MTQLNRRDFIKIAGCASAGVIVGMGLFQSNRAGAATSPLVAFEPNAFLRIQSDGRIIIISKNPEIGQGIKTSMPQIIAEELDVDWRKIEIHQGILDRRLGAQFAGGSTGIKTNFDVLRKAGAAARAMLLQAASQQWDIPTDQCFTEQGHVVRKGTKQKLTYASLADQAGKLSVPENPRLKDRRDYKIIGKPLPGVDNREIVTGKAEFGIDSKPKGMLVALVERCPVFGGRVKGFDDTATLKINGVERVLKIDPTSDPTQLVSGVAVIAKNTWAAMKGRKALKVEWEYPAGELENDRRLKTAFEKNINTQAGSIREDGNVEQVLKTCKKVHEVIFDVPFLAHAPMEPMNYIADVRADGIDLWGPTQVPGSVKYFAAEMTGVPANKINVRMTRVGGGFGRRLMADYACEAVYISKALSKPVQVLWTREDDIQHDFFRPAGMYKLTGGLDEQNRLVAWDIKASTTSRYEFAGSTDPFHQTEVFPDSFPAGFVPNFRMQYLPVTSPVPRGAWRAPGHNATAWVDQSFIDEMAVQAGKDPIAFRLDLLGEEDRLVPYRDHGGPTYSTKRLKNVIRLAAERSGWNNPAPTGVFRGFACHFMFGAYVAEVISISMQDQKMILEKALAVVDCGLVINPGGARNQMEGGIIDGLSAALHQSIHISGGKATENNFNEYKLLRMKDAPDIEVYLVDSEEPPEGLGEMTLPPVAAALCNAIRAATGKRIKSLPINLSDAKI